MTALLLALHGSQFVGGQQAQLGTIFADPHTKVSAVNPPSGRQAVCPAPKPWRQAELALAILLNRSQQLRCCGTHDAFRAPPVVRSEVRARSLEAVQLLG